LSQTIRSSFGYPTILFRVTSTSDGNLYALRRIDSAMKCVNHTICQSVMQQWLSNPVGLDKSQPGGGIAGAFDHPGVVRFYKCFLSQRAVFFLHHYHAVRRVVHSRVQISFVTVNILMATPPL
jgi:PAB-dependent poly(A)-specific ribonuclease subunit 3